MSFGDEMRRARLARGIGLREFCRRVKIHPTYGCAIETRGEIPSLKTSCVIANELDSEPLRALIIARIDDEMAALADIAKSIAARKVVCANPKCGLSFAQVRRNQRFCSSHCSQVGRQSEYYRRKGRITRRKKSFDELANRSTANL